jgi:glucan phosphoethanolaminetransferase (alkaline phosphatase superfamily)
MNSNNKSKSCKKVNIRNIIVYISLLACPIMNEFTCFVIVLSLQLLPVLLYSYFNCESVFYIDIVRFKTYVFSIPFIIFIPFVISYFFCAIFSLLKKVGNRIVLFLFYVLLYTLIVIVFLNTFLLIHFQTMLTPSMIQLILETNGTESSEFLQNYLFARRTIYVLFYVVLFLIMWIVLVKYRDMIRSEINSLLVRLTLSFLVLFFIIGSFSQLSSLFKLLKCKNTAEIELWYGNEFNPDVSIFSNLFYSVYFEIFSFKNYHRIITVSEHALNTKLFLKRMENLDIIVIIGESFNKYHSSLYGYKHNTNPFLNREKHNGNLYVFTNTITPYNMTSSVIKNVFSLNSVMLRQKWYDKPVFTVLYKYLGYKVFFWDNQKSDGKAGAVDFSLNSFLYNSEMSKLSYDYTNNKTFEYDGDLLSDYFDKAVAHGKKNLIIFHLLGQHVLASDRYPKKSGFDVFNVDSVDREKLTISEKEYISDYDNATLYNDYVIERIISKFRKRNCILIYFSDHGEEVYDYREVAGRTHEYKKNKLIMKYQYEIPFVVWCSNTYKRQHADIIKRLYESKDKPFMIDNVSQFLLDIGNINSIYYDSSCDIISPDYKCRLRTVQDAYDFDKIISGH